LDSIADPRPVLSDGASVTVLAQGRDLHPSGICSYFSITINCKWASMYTETVLVLAAVRFRQDPAQKIHWTIVR
jgi:hypothetical protein